MPEVHLPHLDEDSQADSEKHEHAAASTTAVPVGAKHRWKPLLKIVLEVVLIATGVSLGLAGEQWRENRHHRELADASLRRFRSEFVANRAEVERVRGHHQRELDGLQTYLNDHRTELLAHAIDRSKPIPTPLPDNVTDAAAVDFSAWDFALATESLAYIEPDLVASMSSAYRLQQVYVDAHKAIQQSSYSIPDVTIWLNGVTTYFGDAVGYEELLLKQYERILPRLDAAIAAAG